MLLACVSLGPGCQTVAPLSAPTLAAAGMGSHAGSSSSTGTGTGSSNSTGTRSHYGGGRATQEFAFPSPVVQEALIAALTDLKVSAVRQHHDGPARIVEGTTADGRKVNVTLRPGVGAARVSVRIGWFGDEPYAKAILERVGIRLGTLPPAAIPEEPPSAPSPNPFFSRSAIPDAIMFRDQAEAPYHDSPIPRD